MWHLRNCCHAASTGARAFGDYTAAHIGEPFAIVLDDEVISAPTIQSHIAGGSGIITGNFTVEESTNLAKSQILSQASTAMLAQANQSQQGVMNLLR